MKAGPQIKHTPFFLAQINSSVGIKASCKPNQTCHGQKTSFRGPKKADNSLILKMRKLLRHDRVPA